MRGVHILVNVGPGTQYPRVSVGVASLQNLDAARWEGVGGTEGDGAHRKPIRCEQRHAASIRGAH